MSMLFGTINKYGITVASDSRLAVEKDGVIYAADDNFKKLFVIGNDLILWGSGRAAVIQLLADKIEKTGYKDIHKIVVLANAAIEEYKKHPQAGPPSEDGYAQIVVAQYVDGKPCVHLTGDKYLWRVVTQEGDTDELVWFGGGTGGEVGQRLYYENEALEESERQNLQFVMQNAFNEAANESVGGWMYVATLSDGNKIKEVKYRIEDSGKDIRRLFDADTSDGHSVAQDLFLGNNQISVLATINGRHQINGDALNLRGTRIFQNITDTIPNNWNWSPHYMSVGAGTPSMPSNLIIRMGRITDGVATLEMTTAGDINITNSSITMRTGDNTLSINPTDFIRWNINGSDQFYYDSVEQRIVLGGNAALSVTTNADIGRRLNMTSTGLADGIHFTSTNASISLNDENTVRIVPFVSTRDLFTEGLAGLGYSGLTAAITDLRNRIIALENA